MTDAELDKLVADFEVWIAAQLAPLSRADRAEALGILRDEVTVRLACVRAIEEDGE
jgi:hypothetical protein